MFSGRRSARSDAGLADAAGVAAGADASAGAPLAASVSVTTGVDVFSDKFEILAVSNLRPCCRFFQRKHQSKSEDRPEKPENSERTTGKGKRPTLNANVEGKQSAAGSS